MILREDRQGFNVARPLQINGLALQQVYALAASIFLTLVSAS
jgi:hypothetical protein